MMFFPRHGLALCCVILLLTALPAAARTPEESLMDVQKAMDTCDQALFERRVNIDGVLRRAVRTFLDQTSTPEGRAALPPILALVLSSVSGNESARDSLASLLEHEMGQFVRYGIRSGAFGGQKPADPPSALFSGSVLAPLMGDISMGRKEIRDVLPPMPDGDNALLAFTVLDHGNNNVYPVMARMIPVADGWRLENITNLDTLMGQIRQEMSSQY